MILQSDIKKMYTFLDHDQIVEAVIWMCNRAKKTHVGKGKRTRSDDKFITISKFKDANTGKKQIKWASTQGSEEEYTFTIDDLILVVLYDLNNSYQSRGKDIFLQKYGCPIGGFLSAIYANVKCAYDEFMFMKEERANVRNMYGIRQMDDLILFKAYDNRSGVSLKVMRKV